MDVLLTPGLGQRPLPIGTIDTQKEDDPFTALIPDSSDFTPYTAVWNVTGQPAISLPLFHGDDGLPLDPARRAADRRGAAPGAGAQLEAERPWADRRPPL